MSLMPTSDTFDAPFGQIRAILTEARSRIWQNVNHEMVRAYWRIGRVLVEEEQNGSVHGRIFPQANRKALNVPRVEETA
jgi:hypothetical protein